MKRFSLLFLVVTSFSFCLSAQRVNEEKPVNGAITKFFDGIAALDIKVMKEHSTANFILLEDGAVWNMDTLVNKLSPLKALNFSRMNHLNFIQTTVNGNTAWVIYENAADMKVGEQEIHIKWLESAILTKEGRDWKIQVLHSTTKPDQK